MQDSLYVFVHTDGLVDLQEHELCGRDATGPSARREPMALLLTVADGFRTLAGHMNRYFWVYGTSGAPGAGRA